MPEVKYFEQVIIKLSAELTPQLKGPRKSSYERSRSNLQRTTMRQQAHNLTYRNGHLVQEDLGLEGPLHGKIAALIQARLHERRTHIARR